MMQSCIESMQVATRAVIVVYRQNKQAQMTLQNKQGIKSRHQGNGGVFKTWHQGKKGVKVQGEKCS